MLLRLLIVIYVKSPVKLLWYHLGVNLIGPINITYVSTLGIWTISDYRSIDSLQHLNKLKLSFKRPYKIFLVKHFYLYLESKGVFYCSILNHVKGSYIKSYLHAGLYTTPCESSSL